MRRISTLLGVCFLLLSVPARSEPVPAPAPAPSVDEASLAAARTLGREGINALKSQDFAVALDKLERAYQVVKAPSLALWSARAHEKNGKLVEAQERYLQATRLQATLGDVATQQQARIDAAREREALLPRIPTLTVQSEWKDIELTIDRIVVPTALLDVPRFLNPGAHVLIAKRGEQEMRREFAIHEGEKQTIALAFETTKAGAPGPGAAANRAAAPSATALAEVPTSTEQVEAVGASGRPLLGWTLVGVGGVGLLVSAVAGAVAWSKKDSASISQGCVNDRCPASLQDEVDAFNSARTVSTISLLVGAAAAGTGAVLLLSAPRHGAAAGAMRPWLGFGTIGVTSSF